MFGGAERRTACSVKNKFKAIIVPMLMGTFFYAFFRIEAYATSPYTPGTLGICTIANPTYDPNNENNVPHPS
ncbi:MAG: hypothetical protein J6Y29_06290, partial [Clostridiales bacterium]|nr:hypothetical protein [Clostridiales bacterium]